MISKFLNKKGLTLIESLLVLAILSILIGSLYVVFKSGLDSWKKAEAKLDIYQNARVAIEQIQRELSQAFVDPARVIYFLGTDGTNIARIKTTIGNEVFFVAPLRIVDSSSLKINPNCEVGFFIDSTNTLKRVYVTADALPATFNYIFAPNDASNELALNITDLKFYYWEDGVTQNWDPTLLNGATTYWDSRVGGAQAGKLPKAVKVKITVKESVPDASGPETKDFETIVYLVNSQ